MMCIRLGTILFTAILGASSGGAWAGDIAWSDPANLPPPKVAPIGWPSRDPNLDALPGFVQPPAGYGEVPFYWWLGDKLTKEQLTWQLDLLEQSGGVSGLQVNYAHGDRGGRSWGLTLPSDPPLFSEAWWDLFRWFMGEAKRRGMAVSLSDYTLCTPGQGWYTDEIIKENPQINGSTLASSVRDVPGGSEVKLDLPENIVAVTAFRTERDAIVAGTGVPLPIEPRALAWKAPEGQWRLVLIASNRAAFSIDPMHPLAGAKYNEKFFGRFEQHAPGEGGRGLNFFFSDELELGISGNLWNDIFAAEFQKRKGYDIRPELAAIFLDIGPRTPKVRLDYRDVVVSLSEENFFRPLFDWHYSRGMTFGCDHGGRGGNVVEFGDYFRTQRWMTGPGSDQPCLEVRLIKAKVNSSISHLYQRPRVWLEGYHSSGWGTTSGQLTDTTARNFVQGYNLLSLHGLYYSLHGGWWEWAPPCNHFRMPYWAHMRTFFDCTRRLSYLMSQGVHRCDTAILYPVAAMEAGMGGDQAVKVAFHVGEKLYGNGEDFDFIDFESVARAKIEDRELRVSGEAYRVLILPAMKAIRHSTIEKALAFYRAGGTVVAIGCLPEASDRLGRDDPQLAAAVQEIFGRSASQAGGKPTFSLNSNATHGRGIFAADAKEVLNLTEDFVLPGGGGSVCHRKVGPRDVYMVVGAAKGSECFFRAKGKVELWDPWTGKCRPLSMISQTAEGTRVRMPLDKNEAQLIVFSPGEPAAMVESTNLDDVTEITVSAGKVSVRGVSTTAGDKMAKVRVGTRVAELVGKAPAVPSPETVEGPWEFELKPTMDNRFGDFQWPPTNEVIGAKVERFRYAQEASGGAVAKDWQTPGLDDSQWQRVTHSYGPRFWKLGPLPDGVDLSAFEAKLAELKQVDPAVPVEVGGKAIAWQPYSYSSRFGVEGDPGHQGYHGLKESVSDEFILLGKQKGGSRCFLWTSAVADRAGMARVLSGGMKPAAAWVRGVKLGDAATVDLQAGGNPLLLRYDGPGRGYFVLNAADPSAADAPVETPVAAGTPNPLAMRWHAMRSLVPFDPLPQDVKPAGWYRFTAPPAMKGMTIKAHGTVEAWTDGKPMTIELLKTLNDGVSEFRAVAAKPAKGCVKVAIRVAQQRGWYGGAAIAEPIRFDCGKGELALGDWSAVDGLSAYSGGAWYRKTVSLPAERTQGRVLLNLGNLSASAEVLVNGKPAGVKLASPWSVDITTLVAPGENRIEVLVYNTLSNHYENIPTRYRGSPQSGLLGPVTVETLAPVVLEGGLPQP